MCDHLSYLDSMMPVQYLNQHPARGHDHDDGINRGSCVLCLDSLYFFSSLYVSLSTVSLSTPYRHAVLLLMV